MKQGWEIKKLGEVCEIQGGSTPKRTESSFWDNGTYPWFTIEDIREQGHIILDTKQKITKVAWDKMRIFPKDTILLCCTASLGEYAITQIPLSSNQQFNGLMIKDRNYLSPMYLMHYCSTLKNTLLSLSGKATIDFVSAEKVRQIPIPIPPLVEQEKIVAELDCLSGVIEKKKQQLKELDALAQSIFYSMFGDPITNEKGWEVKTIENVCSSIVRGPFGSALKKEYFVEPSNSTYKVYEQKHAIQKDSTIGTYYISADMFETLSRFEIKEGDIIMSCSGTIGEFYEIPAGSEKGVMNQALLKYTLNKNIDKIYFLYVMEWVKENFEKKGSGLQNIGSVKAIKSTNISLPPLTLQQEFATKIEAIEKQKALIKESIKETETLFNARMQYYFG